MKARRTPRRLASVGAVAELVRARPPRLGATRLVLIDGPAGSGKTTLASRLAVCLGGEPSPGPGAIDPDQPLSPDAPVQILHADDMYEGWHGLPTLDAVLIDQVLAPMAGGGKGSFRMWDWHRDARTHKVKVPPRPVLIVEGVGVAMRRARELASLVVWIEAAPHERLRRGLARDGEQMREDWLRWQHVEREEFAREGTQAAADVHVDGDHTVAE